MGNPSDLQWAESSVSTLRWDWCHLHDQECYHEHQVENAFIVFMNNTCVMSLVLCLASLGLAEAALTPSTEPTTDVVASGRPNGVLRR